MIDIPSLVTAFVYSIVTAVFIDQGLNAILGFLIAGACYYIFYYLTYRNEEYDDMG